MSNAKKINYSNVKSLSSKTFIKKEHIIEVDGQQFKIMVDSKLKQTEISKIVGELEIRSSYCRRKKIDFDMNVYLYLLLIKYFTDVEFPKVKKDNLELTFKQEMNMMENLLDLGLFDKIIDLLPDDCMQQVSDIFEKYKDKVDNIMDNVLSIDEQMLNNEDVDNE